MNDAKFSFATRRSIRLCLCVTLVPVLMTLQGCSKEAAPDGRESVAAVGVDGSKILLTSEPSGAGEVISVRESAADGDDVVVVGRIGGSKNPWIEGRAAFSIVDNSLKACSDIPGDNCPIPWDYCCETPQLPTSTALIKAVNGQGDLIKADARELLDVKELSTVVVQGKAQRDDAGNLTVLASGIFVRTE